MLKIKKLLKLLSILATLLIGIHIIVMQWNFNFLFPQIQSYFNQNFSVELKLYGEVKLKILPYPKVSITNIKYSDSNEITDILIPKTQVKVNLLKIFNKDELLDLYNISLYNAKIKVADLDNDEYCDILKQYISRAGKHSSKVFFKNAEVEFIDKDSALPIRKLDNLSLTFRNSYDYHLDLNSIFYYNQDKYFLYIASDDLDKDLNPDSITISLQHNLVHFITQLNRDVKADMLKGVANIHFHNHEGSVFSDLKKLVNQQNFKKVSADIEFDEQSLRVYNFTTNSEDIDSIVGEANYYRKSSILDLKLLVDKLNLDQFFKRYYGNDSNEKNKFDIIDILNFLTKRNDFTFSKLITLSAKVNVKKIVFNDDDINNLELDFSSWPSIKTTKQKILVNNFSMLLPGNTKLITDGIISNATVPIYRGEVKFISQNPKEYINWRYNKEMSQKFNNSPIAIKSNIVVMPYILQLYNTQFSSKNTQFLSNLLALNYPGKDKLQLYTKVSANNINLDDFDVDNKFDEIMYTLYSSDYDNSGEEFDNNTHNLNFLRNQKGFKNLTLEIKKLIFKNQVFHNNHVNIDLSKDRLKIDHVNIKHKFGKYSGTFLLSLPGIHPQIEVDLYFTELHDKFLYLILPKKEKFYQKYKKELVSDEKQKTDISDINFYSIGNFGGNFNIDINKLYFKDIVLDNLSLKGDIKDREINFKNISANGFDGELKANGYISTMRPIIYTQFGVGLGNINPSLIFEKMLNYKNYSGYVSATGIFSSKGINHEDIKQNFNGELNVTGKNIVHNGLGLDELANLPQLQTNLDYKLKRLNYYSRYGDTKFDDVNGTINIKDSLAQITNFKLNNDRLTGLSNLIYSLKDGSLSANSKFSFIPVENSSPIIIGITNSGTLSRSKTIVDISALENYLRKNTH